MKSIDFRTNWIPDFLPIGSLWLETSATALRGPIGIYLTYLPYKAVAEVSNDKEPIGRGRVEFTWFKSQVMSDPNELRVKWFGCQLLWDSNDSGCQLVWDSIALAQKRSFSAKLPLKLRLSRSKTKLFRETSFKIEAKQLKNEAFLRDFFQNWNLEAQKRSFSAKQLKNEAFLRDFLQNWNLEAPKGSISARLPFKIHVLKLQNEACLQDFLQKWHVDQTLDLRIPIRFSDFWADASKVLHMPRKSWAEAYKLL